MRGAGLLHRCAAPQKSPDAGNVAVPGRDDERGLTEVVLGVHLGPFGDEQLNALHATRAVHDGREQGALEGRRQGREAGVGMAFFFVATECINLRERTRDSPLLAAKSKAVLPCSSRASFRSAAEKLGPFAQSERAW